MISSELYYDSTSHEKVFPCLLPLIGFLTDRASCCFENVI